MSAALQSDDGVLLQRWGSAGDQDAFAALVARHVNFVYSAAMRQVRNADAAQEVTQAVFIVLARKAKSIAPERLIAAWLFKAVRYAAGDWNKRETRRQRREKEAARAAQRTGKSMRHPRETSDDWNAIAPTLDDAIQQLHAKHRDVVLLRFFQGKTHQEIAHLLGISETAARQRLSRSLEQIAKTAEDGSFAFPRVPAGQAIVCRVINAAAGQYTQVTRISVLPSQKTDVSLGGKGCAVTGTAVLRDGGIQPPSRADVRVSILLRAVSGKGSGVDFYGTIEANGKFRVADIPAGSYLLTVTYSKPKPGGSLSEHIDVGIAEKTIAVPQETSAPVDVGLVEAVARAGGKT